MYVADTVRLTIVEQVKVFCESILHLPSCLYRPEIKIHGTFQYTARAAAPLQTKISKQRVMKEPKTFVNFPFLVKVGLHSHFTPSWPTKTNNSKF